MAPRTGSSVSGLDTRIGGGCQPQTNTELNVIESNITRKQTSSNNGSTDLNENGVERYCV